MNIKADTTQVSIYPKANVWTDEDRAGAVVPLGAIVSRIRTGAKGLDKNIAQLRKLIADGKDKAYRERKAKILPAATFSGVFSMRIRRTDVALAENWTHHTGLVTIDIDDIDPAILPELLEALSKHLYVLLVFVSPSGTGLKVVCRISPIPDIGNLPTEATEYDAEHKFAWRVCRDMFNDFLSPFGLKCDGGDDPTRLCFLSHDPGVVFNPDAGIVDWDRDAFVAEEIEAERRAKERPKATESRHSLESRDWGETEVDPAILDYIDPDLEYNDWFRVVAVSKSVGFTWQEVDGWCRKGTKYREGDIEKRWDGIPPTGGASYGTLVYFAQQRGYEFPKRRTDKRYDVDKAHNHTTSHLDTERTANKSALTQWLETTDGIASTDTKELLVLGSAAGTGKTTVAITTAETLFYISKTIEEADQVYHTLYEAEDDVIRHRPRLFNRDHKDWDTLPLGLTERDRPCIQPELCNLYADRGHPTHEVCKRCPAFELCETDGYLAQEDLEKDSMKVVYAGDEAIACDKLYTERVKRICDADDVLIVDEVNPSDLSQLRTVTRESLMDLTTRFQYKAEVEYSIIKGIQDLISTADSEQAFIQDLKAQIEAIDDICELDKKIEKFPVGYVFIKAPEEAVYNFEVNMFFCDSEVTVPVVSYEVGEDTPVFEVEPDRTIDIGVQHISFMPFSVLQRVELVDSGDPPYRYNNLITDIKAFIDENTDIENAPFAFDPKTQVFEYHLRPTLNHRRAIFNTASDPDDLISEAYKGTDVAITRHTGALPHWKDAHVFQLETGNYLPRHSLLSKDGDTYQLKPKAQELIDGFVKPSIAAGLKVLVVGPQKFQECPELTGLDIELTNHHRAEGRNDYQDHDIAFVFHYEPNHHEVQKAAKRIYRNPDPPLNFERAKREISVNAATFTKKAYTDDRVQAVYNRECRERLMQAALRLRPNINPGKVVVFFTAEPVNIPITPMPFTCAHAKDFTGDWRAFHERLTQRRDESSAKAYAEREGVSKRTAERHTKDARQDSKAERDYQIIRRFADGDSKKKIASDLGVGQATVKRVLDAQKF